MSSRAPSSHATGFLRNPEEAWDSDTEEPPKSVRAQVVERIGPTDEDLQVLSGGQANLNVRVGQSLVLRVYRRDPTVASKEATLLGRQWRSFRMPSVVATGEDFILLEHVPHGPLAATAEMGKKLGRVLAEIHETSFDQAGFLGPGGELLEPFPDFLDALCDHLRDLERSPAGAAPDRVHPVLELLEANSSQLRDNGQNPLLLHGDFKVSNLHCTEEGELLVLDWEFAYAGPALMDVGQLLRWSQPEPFLDAFEASYQRHGGSLPAQWRRLASTFDLVNLVDLLSGSAPGSQRALDLCTRIEETLDELGS